MQITVVMTTWNTFLTIQQYALKRKWSEVKRVHDMRHELLDKNEHKNVKGSSSEFVKMSEMHKLLINYTQKA